MHDGTDWARQVKARTKVAQARAKAARRNDRRAELGLAPTPAFDTALPLVLSAEAAVAPVADAQLPEPDPEPEPGVQRSPRYCRQPAVVEHVLSLGSLCFTAQFMQRQNLRRYAGPFDWLSTDARVVTHCLDTDFVHFLDAAQYIECAGDGHTAGHRMYDPGGPHRHRPRVWGPPIVFTHHNPLANPRDHAHFVRSTERLRQVLRSPERKLLLLVDKGRQDAGVARALWEALLAYGARNFELLMVGLLSPRPHKGERKNARMGGATSQATPVPSSPLRSMDGGACTSSDAAQGVVVGAAPGGSTTTSTTDLVVEARVATPDGECLLQAWTLDCPAGHTGVVFKDARDDALFEQLVMDEPGGARTTSDCTPKERVMPSSGRRRQFALKPDPLPPRAGSGRT